MLYNTFLFTGHVYSVSSVSCLLNCFGIISVYLVIISLLQYKLCKSKNLVCLLYLCNFSTRMVPAHNKHLKNACWINGEKCKVAFPCLKKLSLRETVFIQSHPARNGRLEIKTHFIPMSLLFYPITCFIIPTGFPDTHGIFSKTEKQQLWPSQNSNFWDDRRHYRQSLKISSNRLGEGICNLYNNTDYYIYKWPLWVNKQKTSNPLETWVRNRELFNSSNLESQ